MLNEPTDLTGSPVGPATYTPFVTRDEGSIHQKLRAAVDKVFIVESEHHMLPSPITATYIGHFSTESGLAYDILELDFGELDHIPVFREEGGKAVIRAVRRYKRPEPRKWWPNLVLFIATVLSLLYTGAVIETGTADLPSVFDILKGWPYAIGLISILGAHEMGHYIAARRNGVAVTLPYFIPMPLAGSLGTLGAFIQLREPVRDRRALLEIGAAGPLAGLIIAIPVLLIGLATSKITSSPDVSTLGPDEAYIIEGDSLLYAGAKLLIFGRPLPGNGEDVLINQLAQAGWTGLLVTAINLIPIGQLDGGHTMFSLFGDRARGLYTPLLMAMFALSLFYQGWVLWVFLLLMLGRNYAAPLNSITPLKGRHRTLAIVTLIVLILVFVPVPFRIIGGGFGG